MMHKVSIRLALAAGLTAVSQAYAQTILPFTAVPGVAHATLVGTPPASQTVYVSVSLKPRFPAELEAFVKDVSNPRSPNYRNWLTPAQVGAQFGASPSTVASVVNYLKSKGLRIVLQAPDQMAILAQGTITQVQNAFSTTIKNYRGPDILGNVINFRANTAALKVPSAWAANVQAIGGIESWHHPVPRDTSILFPALTRGCYGLVSSYNSGFNGQGRTIGISNWDGFELSNIPLYVNAFHLPVPSGGAGSNVSVVTIDGGSQGGPAQGEGDLDFQMELGAAPLANIIIYDGGFPDLVAVLTREASDNKADVISESYGEYIDNSTATAAHNQHLAMSAQGMTYMEATGDEGTNIIGDYNGSDPEIFGVGGTVVTVNSTTGTRVSEVAWDGSGGGWTTNSYSFNVRPDWQKGAGFPSQPNERLMPDVSLMAGPDGYDIFYAGTEVQEYGTSASSPTFAGGLTVVEQMLDNAGTTARLGNIGELIYAQQGRPDVWFDVISGPSTGVLPNGQNATVGLGWDFETGWGAPNFDALYTSLLQEVALTPYTPTTVIDPPSSNPPLVGTWLFGDATSISTADGIDYQEASQAIPQFGEAASFGAQFFVPTDTAFLEIELQANSDGFTGGTNMIWFYNWNTGNYDLVGSTNLDASVDTDRILKVSPTKLSNYIGPSGEVDAVVRAHFPIKPIVFQMPAPFTYRVDLLQLLAR
ncbi:MAG TPA: protease pro-enzyme activation domain-containing protein [Fimbriimonadaceae bacterium]|nr:protease pro-enzyme activation domain-containing protein [Fimbriimonadaceae bacterium]